MRHKVKIITGTICFCIYLFSCAPNSGNGTLTGNPVICGRVFQSDGITAAKNAIVYLRDKNALIDISSIGDILGNAITQTDKNGFFEIDSVGNGTYTIECTDGKNNYALYDSVSIVDNKETVHLPADTLKPAGAIKGRIRLPEGGDPVNVYALAFGVDRFSICDTSGKFKLKNISEGTYSLRFMSSLSGYGTYDTTNVRVISGDTSDIGTIELPYTDVPTPKNVAFTLDTMKQIVTITWDSIDVSRIYGYNLYKKMATDKIFNKCNPSLLKEPFYRDEFVETNKTYLYRVCTFNKDSTEGVKSKPCSLTVSNSHIIFIKEFREINVGVPSRIRPYYPKTLIASSNGYIYGLTNKEVLKYDTNFNILNRITSEFLENPFEIASGKEGRVYVSCRNSNYPGELHTIRVFNDDCTLHKVITVYEKDSITGVISGIGKRADLFSVNNKEQLAIVSINRDTVYLFDTAGVMLRSVGSFGDGMSYSDDGVSEVQFDLDDNVYINDFGFGLKVYDSTFNNVRIIHFDGMDQIGGVYVDPVSKHIMMKNGYFYIYKTDGQMVLRCQLGTPKLKIQNSLFVLDDYLLKKYFISIP